MKENMKTILKLEIFDVDVGGNVHEQVFGTSDDAIDDALNEVKKVIDSYELDAEFADAREIEEDELWFADELYNRLYSFVSHVYATFIDSVSIWLPGHHRKIILTKIEENN